MSPPAGVALVIPAAGSGRRFGGCKQLRLLAGRAVLLRAIDPFVALVERIVIVVAPAIHEPVAGLVATEPWAAHAQLVPGGATRMDSVYAGLQAAPEHCDRILVHDAARPLVTPQSIAACIAALEEHPAALVAQSCPDTVKRVVADTVTATVPRADLYLAQTPQGLRRAPALAAFARATAAGWTVTDDVEIMERCGHSVAVVPGNRRNIKLTTPEDLAWAEAMLAADAPSA
ncbi:MAG: 2-C-methyl-D-erythritol 4-phosphate cytidylyltransferase [Planctomycetota bacterium]